MIQNIIRKNMNLYLYIFSEIILFLDYIVFKNSYLKINFIESENLKNYKFTKFKF